MIDFDGMVSGGLFLYVSKSEFAEKAEVQSDEPM
jgi:hypothetical protein